jgi:L-histidine Nalpha-methyltransferase
MPTAGRTARFSLTHTDREVRRGRFAEDVRAGLTANPRRLPCSYFYDAKGSILFEQICDLPEYYLTRTEREILRLAAPDLAAMLPDVPLLVELGSGSASKTRLLLEAFLANRDTLCFVPVDISPTILEESARALLNDYDRLDILGLVGEYERGLDWLRAHSGQARLILFLGSTVGNLTRTEAAAFLHRIGETMSADDRLLVGIDLLKDPEIIERAYNDAAGVTERFNLNILERINRELGGTFEPAQFRHLAYFNEVEGRIEMYLESRREQRVRIDDLDLEVSFAAGQRIHTEHSYKYTLAEIERLAQDAGLQLRHQWFDPNHWFSLNLFSRSG